MYKLTNQEKALLKKNNHDWDDSKFDELKKNIRDYARIQQGNRCCYCKSVLPFDKGTTDIEHILPKKKYPNFVYEPKNLALACKTCNTNKGEKEVLNKTDIKRYPSTSTNVKIIHHHYDKYEDHIDIIGDCVYYPISSKGQETSTICKLWELVQVLKKSRETYYKGKPIDKIMNDLMNLPEEHIPDAMRELTRRLK